MNSRNLVLLFKSLLVAALVASPTQANPIYFGDAAWQRPGSCGGNVYTQHLCFPNDASPARTALERQIIAPYLARGYAASSLLFVGNRQPTIEVDIVATGWVLMVTGSLNANFANRSDSHLHVLVDGSLFSYGINTNGLPDGTIVIAHFADGAKAVFKLVVTPGTAFTKATRRWQWTGQAWNAEGFEIDRTGNMRYPIIGPPAYEFGGYGGRERGIGSGLPASGSMWIGTPSVRIEWIETITVTGGGSTTMTILELEKH